MSRKEQNIQCARGAMGMDINLICEKCGYGVYSNIDTHKCVLLPKDGIVQTEDWSVTIPLKILKENFSLWFDSVMNDMGFKDALENSYTIQITTSSITRDDFLREHYSRFQQSPVRCFDERGKFCFIGD